MGLETRKYPVVKESKSALVVGGGGLYICNKLIGGGSSILSNILSPFKSGKTVHNMISKSNESHAKSRVNQLILFFS